jgi:hypothetical protein
MMTLEDAWRWHETTKRHIKLFGRLGEKYWSDLAWDGPLGRDDKLKSLDSGVIVKEFRFCVEHLDDFAILVLFSAFESAMREQVLSMIDNERNQSARPLVVRILDDARQETKRGRILRVLGFFKNQDAGLVEKVNQVRRYRNWVAHGRRTIHPAAVDPTEAYERLKEFLDRFASSVPDEQ